MSREEKIKQEILSKIIDINNNKEVFTIWFNYLEKNITFPFYAKFKSSFKKFSVRVKVNGLLEFSDSKDIRDILVEIEYNNEKSLEQLLEILNLESDTKTKEAIENFQYWINYGNTFWNDADLESEDEELSFYELEE
ncbi:MAG: calcium-binding protein [Candidatus Sericytochromatia bacterium]